MVQTAWEKGHGKLFPIQFSLMQCIRSAESDSYVEFTTTVEDEDIPDSARKKTEDDSGTEKDGADEDAKPKKKAPAKKAAKKNGDDDAEEEEKPKRKRAVSIYLHSLYLDESDGSVIRHPRRRKLNLMRKLE